MLSPSALLRTGLSKHSSPFLGTLLDAIFICRFIAESPFLSCLDLNVFRLALPAQGSLFDHLGYPVHEDDHDHQNDDADEDVGGLKNSRRHANEKTKPFGGCNEFTDDGADDGKGDAGSYSGKNIWGDCRKNDFECKFPTLYTHEACQVDILAVHLPHPCVGIKKIQKEGEEENDTDLRPEAYAKPHDEERRYGGARDAIQRDDDGFKNV